MDFQDVTVTLIFIKDGERRVASARTPAQFASVPEIGQTVFVEDDPGKGGAPISGIVDSIKMEFRKGTDSIRQVYEVTIQ